MNRFTLYKIPIRLSINVMENGHNLLERRFLGPVGRQKRSNLSMFASRNHRPIKATNQSGNQIVCFTAVLCVLKQRSSTCTAVKNRTTFLSAYYPIRFQLPFSGSCSRHVYTTVTPPSQLFFYRCPICE